MNKKSFVLIVMALLGLYRAWAETLPPECFAEPAPGTYYLYNVKQQKYLTRLSNNFPELSPTIAEITLKQRASGYTLMFADGKYLKTGFWNSQYLWTDGNATDSEAVWTFEPTGAQEHVYRLRRSSQDTWNGTSGIFYANGTNAAIAPTEDCQWALISQDSYAKIARQRTIPDKYRSETPVTTGQYYLYDVLSRQFLNTATCSLSCEPDATSTITRVGENQFLISGANGKYLKIGVYKGQYLWADGEKDNTLWTFNGNESEKAFYIFSNNFKETNAEVAGKTMYINGTNATPNQPKLARWALITQEDYVAFLSSGEAYTDSVTVSANKELAIKYKGNVTALLQNPSFERNDKGWWGGQRVLSQLYRGSGYAYEISADSLAIQTLQNMPQGTYKVVAAVSGNSGTTVTAQVAGMSGDAVVNGQASSQNERLNMNGVSMPYSSAGGFNDKEEAKEWKWATATGTLEKDGHLNVGFVVEGSGDAQIADVHLYYMSDSLQTFAVDYGNNVDVSAHAVCCDLTANNPNQLFTSSGAITTVSGAKLWNNLIGGTVSELVLWDGYDFAPQTPFIANKATYFRTIQAASTAVVCLPFAISASTTGSFYEPKNIDGKTLYLKTASQTEAGKAYFYRSDKDVNMFTGSGNVVAMPLPSGSFIRIAHVPAGSYVQEGNQLKKNNGQQGIDAFRAFFTLDSEEATLQLNFKGSADNSVWKHPQPAVTDFTTGSELYLYNANAARFYTKGNAYGTQASVGDTGLKVKFVLSPTGTSNAAASNGQAIVKIQTYAEDKGDWQTSFITTNGAVFVDGDAPQECYWMVVPSTGKAFKLMPSAPNTTYNQENYPEAMFGLDLFENDLRTNLAALLFKDEEPGSNIYLTDWQVCTPNAYKAYQQAMATYKTALQLKDLLDEATAKNKDVTRETGIYNNSNSTQEELMAAIDSVTEKLLADEIGNASAEHPVNITDKFILNPRYADNNNEGWSGSAPNIDVAANLQNAEFFNTNFDCYQDLHGLPDGYYQLKLQGFYRAGLEAPSLQYKMNGTEEQVMNAVLYASTQDTTVTAKLQSVFTGAPTEALGVNGEIHNGSWWVPNTMSAAAAYFAKGYYNGNSVLIHVTNGQMRIGLRKQTTIRRDWVMMDNWELNYFGKEKPAN